MLRTACQGDSDIQFFHSPTNIPYVENTLDSSILLLFEIFSKVVEDSLKLVLVGHDGH